MDATEVVQVICFAPVMEMRAIKYARVLPYDQP